MIRQYIGARYVTKIYENSLDPSSAEWQSSRAYEPLTLVTYLNSSYLSKKEVPANIGDPASNPSYWVITGAYNGQIATLQSQIDSIDAIVTQLATYNQDRPTKIACIGDSYGMKISNNWCSYLKQIWSLDDDHFINKCTGNAGFVGNAGYKTFLEQLQEITDKDTYTHIIIVGGFNDAYRSDGTAVPTSTMQSAINTAGSYIKTNFPNAKTFLGFAANVCNLNDPVTAATIRANLAAMENVYSWFGAENGMAYMSDVKNVLHDTQYLETSDIVYNCVFHPNATGGYILARCITSYIKGGDFNTHNSPAGNLTKTDASGISVSNVWHEYMDNENVMMNTTGNVTITFSTPMSYSDLNAPVKITELTHRTLYPNQDQRLNATVKAHVTYSDSTTENYDVTVILKGNDVYIWALPPSDTGKSVSTIVLFQFMISSSVRYN